LRRTQNYYLPLPHSALQYFKDMDVHYRNNVFLRDRYYIDITFQYISYII